MIEFNQSYDPRGEQIRSRLSGRLRHWCEDPEETKQKQIDKVPETAGQLADDRTI